MSRRLLAFDSETHLIKGEPLPSGTVVSTMLAPRPVCYSWAWLGGEYRPEGYVLARRLDDRSAGLSRLRDALLDPEVTLVGANIAFDLGVAAAEDPALVGPIFGAYRAGRVRDVQVRQMLIDVARGETEYRHWRRWNPHLGAMQTPPTRASVSLAALSEMWLSRTLEKEDTWRLRYSLLDGVPLENWPADARQYALDDAGVTLEVFLEQELWAHSNEAPWFATKTPVLADEEHQMRAAWALHLASMWGVRTDPTRVQDLDDALEAEHTSAMAHLVAAGLVRPDGSKDLKALRARVQSAYAAMGAQPPVTPKGSVSTSSEALEGTNDPDLLVLAAVASNETIRTSWVPALKIGTAAPVCARYRPILETGRVSCSAPNMMNPPKKGGVRECFVPRPGWLYAFADYDTLELRTLAQECLELVGWSNMAEALKAGRDLHLELAASILGLDPAVAAARYAAGDVALDEWRGLAKVANFGFPGGMVPATFVEYAAAFGKKVPPHVAQQLYAAWKSTWAEMDEFFRRTKSQVGWGRDARGIIVQSSGRVRGDVRYTAACNTRFQGRASDGAKEALWRLAWEMYTGERTDGKPGLSPLFGSRTVVFMHDEVGIETPEHGAHAAAERLGEVMCESMATWVPAIPIKAGPVLMRRWYKGAKAVKAGGVLVPSRPEKQVASDGKERVVWVADEVAA